MCGKAIDKSMTEFIVDENVSFTRQSGVKGVKGVERGSKGVEVLRSTPVVFFVYLDRLDP